MLVWLALALVANPAAAQTSTTYSNTAPAAINETATPCTAPLVRSFAVAANAQVTDVNIGVQLAHTYRGDIRATLISPTGTVVNLITNVGTGADNLNVLFDDSAATSVSTHTANDNTAAAPPYQRSFRPEASLASFNGEGSAGTWQLTICDSLNSDSGTFTRTDLIFGDGTDRAVRRPVADQVGQQCGAGAGSQHQLCAQRHQRERFGANRHRRDGAGYAAPRFHLCQCVGVRQLQ